MHYAFTAIPDPDVPRAADPTFQHVLQTYASETNKTASVWRAVPDGLLDFKPHEKTNPIRTILAHQLLSERRFFAQFVGTEEPSVEGVLPPGEKEVVPAYLDKYIWLAKGRLPQLAQGTAAWWLESRPFFAGLRRERIWVFWRRVLHTCHHRTQVQTWLRLAGLTTAITCLRKQRRTTGIGVFSRRRRQGVFVASAASSAFCHRAALSFLPQAS
jgi:uncharacterized damage-inducible protein DinB